MSRHNRQHEHNRPTTSDRWGHPMDEGYMQFPVSPYKERMKEKFEHRPEQFDKCQDGTDEN